VVADDQRQLARELAGSLAQDEIVQAVVVLRDHDRDAFRVGAVRDAKAHLEPLGQFADGALERRAVGVHLTQVDGDALEKLVLF
jgi:hypothetical protein